MKYTAEGKFRNEKQAKKDLATCAYAGKWKSAKEYVCRHQNHVLPYSYWDAVRLHFLELGGEWLSQVAKPAPIDWSAPLPRPTAAFKYCEPQKVRFA